MRRARCRWLACMLLLPDFGEERIVTEVDWKPSHVLAFVHELREWLVDLGRTAELSVEAELPDPLGAIKNSGGSAPRPPVAS